MELQVDVDEADVGKVKVGQKATFSVDAYPDRKFPATIRDVRFASETIQGVVTYKAVLTIDNSELLLRPGMTATAEIGVDGDPGCAAGAERGAPLLAARRRDTPEAGACCAGCMPGPPQLQRREPSRRQTGASRPVWMLRNGEPAAVAVVIGASDGKHTAGPQAARSRPGDAVIVDQTSGNP